MKIGAKSKPSIKGGREFVAYIFPDALLETILNFNFITEEFTIFDLTKRDSVWVLQSLK